MPLKVSIRPVPVYSSRRKPVASMLSMPRTRRVEPPLVIRPWARLIRPRPTIAFAPLGPMSFRASPEDLPVILPCIPARTSMLPTLRAKILPCVTFFVRSARVVPKNGPCSTNVL